jgi:hypothetical protein
MYCHAGQVWGPRGVMGESAKTSTGDFTGRSVVVIGATACRSDLTAWMYTEEENVQRTRDSKFSCTSLARIAEPYGIVGLTWFLRGGALGTSHFAAVRN